MNCCLVVNSFPTISETFVHRQAQALGCPVVAMFRNREHEKHFDFDYNKVFVLEAGRTSESKIDKFIKRIQGRPCRQWKYSSKKKFATFLTKAGSSVVLAQFGPNGINALDTCKQLKIPLVIQFLGYDASELMHNDWYQANITKALEYASAIVVLYAGMAEPLIKLGCPAEKINVINIGVPVNSFTAHKRQPSDTFEFISVGRFVGKKAPMATLKAFEQCARKNSAARLTMVGHGPLYNEVEAYRTQSSILNEENVNLPGYLSQTELASFYRRAHCFLQHSITDTNGNKEGWPVGIAEACASGLPVISTRHAGIVDQVIHKETGYLVEENDWHSMADFMLALSQDFTLCETMGIKGREHIETHGNQKNQIQKLIDVLESVGH